MLADILVEQFKIASEDSACSHILYAACHDSAYLSQLVPLSGRRDKITLVQGAGWNSDFHHFNLNVTQFPTVFRWSELPTAAPSAKVVHTNGNATPKPNVPQKKNDQHTLTGPRQVDSWRNGPLSPRGSVVDGEGEGSKNGFGSGVGFGSKLATSNKSSPQLCKYFQKVNATFEAKPGSSLTFIGLLSLRQLMHLPAYQTLCERHKPTDRQPSRAL
jgi:hypothetical protein